MILDFQPPEPGDADEILLLEHPVCDSLPALKLRTETFHWNDSTPSGEVRLLTAWVADERLRGRVTMKGTVPWERVKMCTMDEASS